MVDQSNTIISFNWPYWRSLYHGHNIIQVKNWVSHYLKYLKAVLRPNYCVQAIFTSVGGDASGRNVLPL
jgi:hypothetical protein